jgi:hypothetical protein
VVFERNAQCLLRRSNKTINKPNQVYDTTMNDEEYAAALIQELRELTEALVYARKDHEHAVDLLKTTRRAQLSLEREVEQRSAFNKSLLEQELLRQQIDSKKREKTRILKELAAARWNHDVLQRAAGFSDSKQPASNGTPGVNEPAASVPNEGGRAYSVDDPNVTTSPHLRRRKPLTPKGHHPRRRTSNLNGSFSSIDAFSASDSPESDRGNQRTSRRQRSSRNLSYSSLRASSFGDSASKLSFQGEEGIAVGQLTSGKCKRRSRAGGSSSFNNSLSSLSTKSSSTNHTLRGRRKSGNCPFTSAGSEIQTSVGSVQAKPLQRSASFDESDVLAGDRDVSAGRLQRSCSLGSAHASKERIESEDHVNSLSLAVEGGGHSNDSRALNGSKHPPKRMSLDDFSSDEDTSPSDDEEL